jgi:phage terminase large subunit
MSENRDWFYSPGKMYRICTGSYWNRCKTVIPGDSGEGYDDEWSEDENIKLLRERGGVFISDAFLFLFEQQTMKSRLISLDGGYGSGKTTSVITQQLIKSQENEYHRCYYGRQVFEDAKKKFHSSIVSEIKRNKWQDKFDFSEQPNGSKTITCKANGNRFEPFGCDNKDFLKGLDNPTDIIVDEVNQISFESFGMLFSRTRGSGYKKQMLVMFNNCDVYEDHWVRMILYPETTGREIKAKDKKEEKLIRAFSRLKTIRHHSTYLDNQFQNPKEYYEQLVVQAGGDEDKIEAYCNGEWGVSLAGQPFYKQFNPNHHVSSFTIAGYEEIGYNPNLPLHISWDENVNPYLPVLICQIYNKELYVINEIAAKNPFNSLDQVCEMVCNEYPLHTAGMFVYGDATSQKEDVKIEKGKNFFVLALEYLSKFDPILRKQDSNPNVRTRGNFINMIFSRNYEGIVITIAPECRHLIGDLKETPESPDGKGKHKQKSKIDGISGVQKYGHMSDCLDYVVCEAFSYEYALFQTGSVSVPPKGGGRVVNNGIAKPTDRKVGENSPHMQQLSQLKLRKRRTNGYN